MVPKQFSSSLTKFIPSLKRNMKIFETLDRESKYNKYGKYSQLIFFTNE